MENSRESLEIPPRYFTMADAYCALCAGEQPWVALSEFQHAWYEASFVERAALVHDPIELPASPTPDEWRWAVFCSASVEWLCQVAGLACPVWALNARLRLDNPWFDFDSPGSHKDTVRAYLLATTPEPFARRNIYCGDRVFADKSEFAMRSVRASIR
jgi:hypothetical protein